ncbi:hypothetical protein HD554DRAFT_2034485 [Boletus coccyginus]|nr:hypothetical protein HD554DRAFT_2034485 [Boletus coccyginus]
MNTSYQIDDNVLVAMACIQAALEIVPHIIGPKKVWGPWMQDHLKIEEKKIFMLLKSFKGMLGNHHRNGMGVDTLLFDAMHADDPSTCHRKVDTPPTVPLQVKGQSLNVPVQGSSGLKLKLKQARSSVAASNTAVRTDDALTVTIGPAASQSPSHTDNGSESMWPAGGLNGNMWMPEDEGRRLCEKKRKKFKSWEFVDMDENEDDIWVSQFKCLDTKHKMRVVSSEASGDLEGVGSRVCDALNGHIRHVFPQKPDVRLKTALAHEAASKPTINRKEWRDKMDAHFRFEDQAQMFEAREAQVLKGDIPSSLHMKMVLVFAFIQFSYHAHKVPGLPTQGDWLHHEPRWSLKLSNQASARHDPTVTLSVVWKPRTQFSTESHGEPHAGLIRLGRDSSAPAKGDSMTMSPKVVSSTCQMLELSESWCFNATRASQRGFRTIFEPVVCSGTERTVKKVHNGILVRGCLSKKDTISSLEEFENVPLQDQLKVYFNQVHLGKGESHKTRQTYPKVEDIPVLITVETHSMIETREVTCGTGTETDLLSKVVTRYFSDKLEKYVHFSRSSLKGMIALFCGPTFEIENSRKDLEKLISK